MFKLEAKSLGVIFRDLDVKVNKDFPMKSG